MAGRSRATRSSPIDRSVPADGRDARRAARIGRPAGTRRRAGGRRVLDRALDRPWRRASFQFRDPQPGDRLALAHDREAAPPVELPRRSVVTAGRHQGRAVGVAHIELVEQRARDAAPKRPRGHDQAVDVDGPVAEDLPRDGARQARVVECAQPLQPGRLAIPRASRSAAGCHGADEPGLDRVRLALELEHGPGDRLVRQVERDRQDRRGHSRRSRQMFSDGQRRAHASSSALRYVLVASAGGRGSTRSSTTRPFARKSRIHSPYVSWK